MTFIEHLDELRTRLIRVLIILVVAFGACYHFSSDISEFLLLPLREALGNTGKIIFTGIFDKVISELEIAFWSAVIVSCPLWFREAWLFIRPALYDREAKAIFPFILVGFVLFILGVCFGYYILFPLTFSTLLSAGVQNVEAMMNLQEYLILSLKVLVLLGFMFQLPNVMLILGFMGLVTKYSLRNIRRYLAVAFAFFAAVITPGADILSMMSLWIPMMVLYEIGIIAVALIVHPYLHRKTMETEALENHSSEQD